METKLYITLQTKLLSVCFYICSNLLKLTRQKELLADVKENFSKENICAAMSF